MIRFSDLANSFRDGRDSPREFLERCIDAIEAREPEVRAFVVLDVEGARSTADEASARWREGRPLSPVDGCPFGAKDIIETADLPTGMNSPIFEGWQSRRDAACVRALRQGGAILLGKTVTTEFAAGRSGPTVHPLDPTRTPGGSSSGSAAAVAAAMVPVALGSQAGGSTIRPASYCGVVGYKPTVGTFSMAGVHTVGPTLDHVGILGSELSDVWSIARQIDLKADTPGVRRLPGSGHAPPPATVPSRLVHLHTAGWAELDAEAIAAFDGLVGRLRAAGVRVSDRDDHRVAELESTLDAGVGSRLDIMAWEMRWPFEEYVDHHGPEVGEIVHGYVRRARSLTRGDYENALGIRGRVRAELDRFRATTDGFITFASSGPAPVGLDHTGSRTFLNYGSWLGLPCFSLPLMTVGGLPVGLQLIGFDGADDRLAGLARWLMETLA